MDKIVQFTDPSFDEYLVQYYDLSLRANLKGFSFCINDSRTAKYLAFKSVEPSTVFHSARWADKLIELLSKEEILLSPFRKVRIMFESPWATLVPDVLFSTEKANTFFQFMFPDLVKLKVFSRKVAETDASCVFGIPERLVDFSTKIFQFPTFFHQSVPFIKNNLHQNGLSGNCQAFIAFYSDFMDVMLVEKEKLLLYNTFTISSPADALYFILLALERLQIDKEKIIVSLSGQVQRKSELADLLRKYLKNVHIGNVKACIPPHFPLSDQETMKHNQLFNLFQCE